MKILVIPSWFPSVKNPIWGDYLIKQACELSKLAEVNMLHVNRRGFKEFIRGSKKYQKDGFDDKRFGFGFYQISILNLKAINVTLSFYLYAFFAYRVFKKMKRVIGKPDVIVAQSILPAGLAARYISKKEKIPYVIHEHSINVLEHYGKYAPKLLENSSGVFAVSEVVKRKLTEFSDKEVVIVPNFIDVKSFDVERKSHDTFNLISIANFYKVKALEVLIEAMSILVEQYDMKNIRLNIVGTGEYEDYYKLAAKKFKMEQYVNFTGYLTKEKIIEYMKISDLLCVSSRGETFAIPVIEALACGIPVISTKCGGPEEMINDEIGVLVSVDDPQEYAKGILKIYHNYDFFDSGKLKDYVFKRYDKKVIGEKFINELKKTLDDA